MSVAARHPGIDGVRGLALLSMFVAHAAPYDFYGLSDFLTAALFATLVGVGIGMSPGRGSLLPHLVRGACLVALGLPLERAGAQVWVILVWLGALTCLVALLRNLPAWALAGVALLLWSLEPWLRDRWQPVYGELYVDGHTLLARLVELAFVGEPYRLTALLVWAILGLLAARLLLRRRDPAARAWEQGLGLVALGVAVLMFVVLDRGLAVLTLVPYSGTHAELAFDALLAAGTLLLGVGVITGHTAFAWLGRLGRMTLTLYTVHVLWLAFLAREVLHGRTDDGWPTLASLVLGAVLLAEVWARVPVTRRLGRGPLELVVDRLVRVTRRTARLRPGSPGSRSPARR